MPIYEYQCSACAHRLETIQSLSEAELTDCPVCGKPALHKLISAAAFRLKGKGWYETDFKSGNKKNLTESDTPPSAGTAKTESSPTATDAPKQTEKKSEPAAKQAEGAQ